MVHTVLDFWLIHSFIINIVSGRKTILLNLTKQRCQYGGYGFNSKYARQYYFTNSLSGLAHGPALNRFSTTLVINLILLHINRPVTVYIWIDFLLQDLKYKSVYECRRKIDVKYP
jgi:hypothetical protein